MVPTRIRTRSLHIESLTPYPLGHEIADDSTIGVFIYSTRALRTRESEKLGAATFAFGYLKGKSTLLPVVLISFVYFGSTLFG